MAIGDQRQGRPAGCPCSLRPVGRHCDGRGSRGRWDGRPQVGETSWRAGDRPVGLCRFRRRVLEDGDAGRSGWGGRSPCTLRPVGGHGGRDPGSWTPGIGTAGRVALSLRPVGHTGTVPGGGDRPWDFAVLKLERGPGTGDWDRWERATGTVPPWKTSWSGDDRGTVPPDPAARPVLRVGEGRGGIKPSVQDKADAGSAV